MPTLRQVIERFEARLGAQGAADNARHVLEERAAEEAAIASFEARWRTIDHDRDRLAG